MSTQGEQRVGTQCVVCARNAEHGYLDEVCFSRLAAMLRDIEDEAATLTVVPSMQIKSGPGGGSLASERAPANLDALVAQDPRRGLMRWASVDADDPKLFDPWGLDDTASVLETLDSRARTVEEESGEPLPAMATITGTRDYLTRQLPWIARQPWVDEFYTELRELLGQLQRTNKTQPDRPVGICQLPRHESICGGRIWQRELERHVWRQAEAGGDRCVRQKVKVSDGPAFCERCRNTWDDPVELDRMRLIEEQRQAEAKRPKTDDGRRMLTAQELVAGGYVSSVSNVRVKAHRLGASSVNGHYDPNVFIDKATA